MTLETRRLVPREERRAQVWEGIVRMMEGSGRTKIEINLSDAREAALAMRSLADGRKQAAQAQIASPSERGAQTWPDCGSGAQEGFGTDRLHPLQAGKAIPDGGHNRSSARARALSISRTTGEG
jgi:hypothetical protein